MIRFALLLLFVLSGATGLVYEVAWTRRLVLVLGNSTHAVALILAAFMLGLALGSFVFGRRADRIRRPVLTYGILEAGVGLYALAFPLLMDGVTAFYVSLGPATGTSYAVKFALAFLVLLVPAFLMGGTLPVIVRWAVDRLEVVGGRVGAFYGANTFGAVLGSFLAGYVLIEEYGVIGATRYAASLNLLVAAAAILLDRVVAPVATGGGDRPATEEGAAEVPPGLVAFTAVAFAVTGFCALALEVLWTRMLVFFLQGFTYAFCAMLTTFLFGLALGAAVLGKVVNRVRDPVRFLGVLLIAIAFASAGALVLLGEMHGVYRSVFHTLVTDWKLLEFEHAMFGGSFLVMLLPTFLMGGVFPAVSRIVTRRLDDVGRSVGWVYALNTLGAVLGSLAAGLVLVPLVGMQWGSVLVLLLEAAVGVALLARHPGTRRLAAPIGAIATVALGVAVVWIAEPGRPFIERSHVFRGPLGHSRKLLDYREGTICAVSVVEDEVTGFRTLYTDEFAAAATGDAYRYMRMLGHLPLMLSPEREDVLIIAFGTGTTAGSVAVHEGVERMDVVEISPEVFDVAHYFEKVNKRVLTRPSPPVVEKHVMDGRNFALTTDRAYDVVTLEPLMPYTPAAVNLYTKDFYEICRARLKPGGVMCQWIPIHAMSVDHYQMLLRSFTDVFPDSSVWFFESTSAVIGRTEEGKIDHGRLAKRVREAGVAEDLRLIGLEDPEAVLSCFVVGGDELHAWLAGIEPMTDEHPTMEFHPVGYGALNSFFADNLAAYVQLHGSVIEAIDPKSISVDPEATRGELRIRYDRAHEFLLGRNHQEQWVLWQNQGQRQRASRHLQWAVESYSEAVAVDSKLFDHALDHYGTQAAYYLHLTQAQGYREVGKADLAIKELRQAVRMNPPGKPHQAWHELGRALLEKGDFAEAEAALRKAIEFFPRRPEYRTALEALLADRGEAAEGDVARARAALAAILGGSSDQSRVEELKRLRGRSTGLAGRLEPELRDLETAIRDIEGTAEPRRLLALRLLLLLEPDRIQRTLATVLADPQQGPRLRGLAVAAAAKRPGHDHLLATLRSGDRDARLLVVRALNAIRPEDAEGALVDALADPDAEVRLRAFVALHEITGEEHGYNPDAPEADREKAITRWRLYLEDRDRWGWKWKRWVADVR